MSILKHFVQNQNIPEYIGSDFELFDLFLSAYYEWLELKTDENPEDIFMEFLQQGGFKNLKDVKHSMKSIKTLRKKGYWIQLLTARPKENLKCLYDTYQWIGNWTDCFDAIDFSTEKFRWCAQSEFYDSGAIKFAIDDSPKHIEEYAKHGIKTLVPLKSYNDFVSHENITFYSDPKEIINLVLEN